MRPDFMTLFRVAEQRVQVDYPQFFAEAIGHILLTNDPTQFQTAERQLKRCLELANEGLAGIDFITAPYDIEADPTLWATIYHWSERAADAGLGITVHAGEFSTANLAAALRVPGLRRIGHAVYVATDEYLLEKLVRSNITIECSLSCNVVLGAVPSYAEHPIRQFVASGIPITLNTDDPVRIWTTIKREYAIASALGFSSKTLLGFTRNAIQSSFTSAKRRESLLKELANLVV